MKRKQALSLMLLIAVAAPATIFFLAPFDRSTLGATATGSVPDEPRQEIRLDSPDELSRDRAQLAIDSVQSKIDPPKANQEQPATSAQTESLANLRSAIEASALQGLDPASIFEAAQAIVRLHASDKAFPELDGSGAMRFPIPGTPDGVTAELAVSKSANPEHASILAIRMHVANAEKEGSYLDGAFRTDLSAEVQVWADHHGELLDMTIMTTVPMGLEENAQHGVNLDSGTFIEGMIYHAVSAGEPYDGLRAFGSKDGSTSSWEVPSSSAQSYGWPRMNEYHKFSADILSMYARIKGEETRR